MNEPTPVAKLVSVGTFGEQDRDEDDNSLGISISKGSLAEAVKANAQKTQEMNKAGQAFEFLSFARWFDTHDPQDMKDYCEIIRMVNCVSLMRKAEFHPVSGRNETWDNELTRNKLFLVWAIRVEINADEAGNLSREMLEERYIRTNGSLPAWVDRS